MYQMTMTNSAGTAVIGAGDSGGPVWRTSGSSKLLQGIVTAGISNLNIVYSTPIYYPILQGFTVKTN